MSDVNKHASLLAMTSHTAEVSKLKQKLEQAEEELGQARKQLEDQQGMYWLAIYVGKRDYCTLTVVPWHA